MKKLEIEDFIMGKINTGWIKQHPKKKLTKKILNNITAIYQGFYYVQLNASTHRAFEDDD